MLGIIDEAIVALRELNGGSGDENLILHASDDFEAVGCLEAYCGRPLPVAFTRVLDKTSLAPTQLGSVFFETTDPSSRSMGYAEWVMQVSTLTIGEDDRQNWLYVAHGDPFQCVLSLDTGEVFGWASGEPFESRFGLNCNFEQLIVGAVVGLVQGDPIAVGSALGSAERFWKLL